MRNRLLSSVFGPSLLRRLVLTQVVLTAFLWLGALFWLSNLLKQERGQEDLVSARKGAAIAFELAASGKLSDQEFAAIVKRFDEFAQVGIPLDEQGEGVPIVSSAKVFIHQADRQIYASTGAPTEPRVQAQNQIVVVQIGSDPWNYFQQIDLATQTRFSVLTPSSGAISFSPWSKSVFFAPLILLLPFVLLPGIFSIWLALRPWRRVGNEVEMKGPHDLTPLTFSPTQRELKPLTKAIDQLLERLRMSNERESRFVADAAHELRTPLAAIHVHLQTLAVRRSASNDSALIETLLRSSDRASRLVVQLLALMRSDANGNEIALKPIDLVTLLQDRLAVFSPMAKQKSIDLELALGKALSGNSVADPIAMVDADQEGITSLVDNLIENAIKYGPVNSKVVVRIELRFDDKWELTVQDNGEGINAVHQARVFDRFFRAPDQTQAGSGLGLAIVKSVADRLGATITLDSAPRSGLTVRVVFNRSV
jgi:signal transduction histidine kinase